MVLRHHAGAHAVADGRADDRRADTKPDQEPDGARHFGHLGRLFGAREIREVPSLRCTADIFAIYIADADAVKIAHKCDRGVRSEIQLQLPQGRFVMRLPSNRKRRMGLLRLP